MDIELFLKTLEDGYSAYCQLLSWIFPYFDPPIIGAIAGGSTVYFILTVSGLSVNKVSEIDKREFEENFVGPKYLTVDDMVIANIRALLRTQPEPFTKEVIASRKNR